MLSTMCWLHWCSLPVMLLLTYLVLVLVGLGLVVVTVLLVVVLVALLLALPVVVHMLSRMCWLHWCWLPVIATAHVSQYWLLVVS